MKFDSVQNAKIDCFKQLFGFSEVPSSQAEGYPLFAPAPGSAAYGDMFKRNDAGEDPRTMIALGVYRPSGSSPRGREDLRLGIFIQRKKYATHPLVEEAVRLSKGEYKVVYTGPVGRRAGGKPEVARPLRVGASVGHHRVTAGTLGAFAVLRTAGGVGILSNNHVLADTNRGRAGDIILQPSRADGGDRKNTDHHVALLHKFVPISFEPGSVNYVDCAFAYLMHGVARDTATLADPTDASKTTWRVSTADEVLSEGSIVKKIGRTTKLTYGVVDALQIDNLFVNMTFGATGRRTRFDRQISIVGTDGAFSRNGDSGSLILTEANVPAGLLFAGGPGDATFANPIDAVCEALDINLYFGP